MKRGIRKIIQDDAATKGDMEDLSRDLSLEIKETEKRLNHRIDIVMEYIDFKLKPMEEMRQDYYDFKDKILVRLDWLIHGFQRLDQELTILNKYVKDSHDRIENHEARLVRLEEPTYN